MKKELEMVEEARKKWEEIIADEKIRDRALRLEIARLDYNTGMNNAREEGIREGIKQGIEKGAKNRYMPILTILHHLKWEELVKLEENMYDLENIVKEMLVKKFPLEIISEITKLDIVEIEKMKKET